MSSLIGFCGRKRSGKGVLSEIVREEYDGVIITSANYLKKLCCDLLGYTMEELNERKDNGYTFFLRPDLRWFKTIHNWTGIEIVYIKKAIAGVKFNNVREMLQIIGTDCIRRYKQDWHVEYMKEDIKKYLSEGRTVIVDDVRFPNERATIEELGGQCYFIVRPTTTNISNHVSETSLTWDMFDDDHVILNCDTLDKLKTNFKEHMLHQFNRNEEYPILLSEMPYFTKVNCNFGKEKTRLIGKLIKQNKFYPLFSNQGVFRFKPSSSEEFAEYIKELYGITVTDNKEIEHPYYKVFNPIIIENLKMHLS